MSRGAGALAAFQVALTLAGPAFADGPTLHGVAAAARAFGGHQERELGAGALGLAALELPITSGLGAQVELGALWLSEGQPPADSKFAPTGDASSSHAGVGLRARPIPGAPRGGLSAAGLWIAGAAGAARTGGETRALADAQVGWDAFFYGGKLGVGPVVGWVHVFQPDSELRPADANVVFAGVHAQWEPARAPVRDADRDRDGIADSLDRCPDVPEDRDGHEDRDGCPDLDNDADGVIDTRDRCVSVPEDRDGFEDADGCPEADNDRDGILDARDRCPNEAEDADDFQDADGCPDPDNDADGILDAKDACPNEAETKNGYADEDGCPDSEMVRVVGDKIVLDERVHFETNSRRLRPASHALLERVAELIRSQPTYVHIEVQGHADERGPDWFNERLSAARARSVLEFLVARGIARSRLSSRGFGASRPLVEKQDERAWYMNRRVEFAITREGRR